MQGLKLLASCFVTAISVGIGCDSSGTGCPVAGETPSSSLQCVAAGGTCMASGGSAPQCPAGTSEILAGQGACGYPSYGGGGGSCGGPTPGPASFPIPCCVPGDGGVDADADAAGDAKPDAPAEVGSCQGTPCSAGCSCGILPQNGKAYCFCEGADAGMDGGTSDAGAPTCGTIWCFDGCTCSDAQKSTCVCP
jgi:hypothetical protein